MSEKAIRGQYRTILVDPPWRFRNRTGKVGPEHKRLWRYPTMTFKEIAKIPVPDHALDASHLYLWSPNAILPEALKIMQGWGFTYKAVITWYKIRKDGGPDGRGMGFYFRNVTENLLCGSRGDLRTLEPARTQTNIIMTQKRGHSIKPEETYSLIEKCSPGPFVEFFARKRRPGWDWWAPGIVVPPLDLD